MSAPTRGTPSRLKSRISGGQSQTGLQMPQPDQSRSLTDVSVELAKEEDLPQRPSHQPPPDGWCILHLRFQQNKQPYLLPNT